MIVRFVILWSPSVSRLFWLLTTFLLAVLRAAIGARSSGWRFSEGDPGTEFLRRGLTRTLVPGQET